MNILTIDIYCADFAHGGKYLWNSPNGIGTPDPNPKHLVNWRL